MQFSHKLAIPLVHLLGILGILWAALPAPCRAQSAEAPKAWSRNSAPTAANSLRPNTWQPLTAGLAVDFQPDTVTKGPRTYGDAGLILGASVMGGFGFIAGWGLSGSSDAAGNPSIGNRLLAAAGGAVFFGGLGAILGALIGSQIPRHGSR